MQNTQAESRLSAPGLLAVLWRYKWMVLVATLLFGLAGWGVSHLQPTMYTAQARLILNDPRDSSIFGDRQQTVVDPSRYVRNRAEYMTSTGVLSRAAELLGGDLTAEQIDDRVTVEPSKELDLVEIDALGETPTDAAALANAVGSAYELETAEASSEVAQQATSELRASRRNLQAQIDQLDQQLANQSSSNTELAASLTAQRSAAALQLLSLQSQSNQILVDSKLNGANVELFERADPPAAPSQPRPLGAALVAAFIGFLAALALAWWRTEHRQNADDRLDAAEVLGVPLLGEVPEFSAAGIPDSLPAAHSRHTAVAESYHFIVSALGFALEDQVGRTVVITSGRPGDGKTVTAANLAIAAHRDGRRVLMVDADERARGLTRLSGVAAEPGLTDLADPNVPVGVATEQMSIGNDEYLSVVPAGRVSADPAGFFRTGHFKRAIERVKEGADLLVIDSPPLLAVSDTSAIAGHADGIVIVVSRGTPLRTLREMRERLKFIGTPVLGYVFNRADPRGKRAKYGYGYGYGYGQDAKETNASGKRRRRPREKV